MYAKQENYKIPLNNPHTMSLFLFLWLLLSPSVSCIQIDETYPTLSTSRSPSLHVSNATSLTGEASCYGPETALTKHALLEDCYTVTRLILTDKKIVLPQTFGKGVAADIQLPYVKKYKTCMIVVDAKEAEVDTFLLLRVAYYAAELIQPCIAQKPFNPIGGRANLDKGSIFVALIGASPSRSTSLTQLGSVEANAEA